MNPGSLLHYVRSDFSTLPNMKRVSGKREQDVMQFKFAKFGLNIEKQQCCCLIF